MVIFYFQKEKLNETEVPQSEIKIHVPDTTKLSPLSVKQAPTAPKLEFSFDSYVESVKGLLLRLFIALNNIHLSDIRKCLLNPRDSFICDMLMCVYLLMCMCMHMCGGTYLVGLFKSLCIPF